MPRSKSKSKSFRAVLETGDRRLGWTIIRVPFDVQKVWGIRGQLKVKGEINGFPFRSSLFASGDGQHFMIVNKKMQAAAGMTAGSTAQLLMEPDTEERTVAMPAELRRAIGQDRALRRWYDQLNYSTRKDIANWVTEPKQESARVRRSEQIAERLLSTMEAEHDLPPILKLAFARNPMAKEGWDRMSPSHRRMQLLAIFYYRNPDSRARRIEKAVQDAADLARRASRRKKPR